MLEEGVLRLVLLVLMWKRGLNGVRASGFDGSEGMFGCSGVGHGGFRGAVGKRKGGQLEADGERVVRKEMGDRRCVVGGDICADNPSGQSGREDNRQCWKMTKGLDVG